MTYTVDEIARLVQGEVVGDGSVLIREVAAIEEAREGSLVLAEAPTYFKRAETSSASCIIAPKGTGPSRRSLIVVENPKAAFARVLRLFHPPQRACGGLHPSAVIGEAVQLGAGATISPFVVIGERVRIGDRVLIGPCCVIGDGCVIEEDTVLHSNVTLYDRTRVGKRVIIHAGAVLGSDGFGFAIEGGRQLKIPQVGIVVIEDDVEVGANVCIDRATLGKTLIRRGAKIDNLVQIGHNVTLGEDSALSAQVGVGGSTRVGKECTLAGQVGIADHVTLGDKVIVGAQSGVAPWKQLKDGEIVWGSPARPVRKSKAQFAATARLPELLAEVAALQRRVADLEARSAR
ncbi:MAG: UDP-3-O-(3-hydroxymyristoyl)glucosamine N-acyltransferase [Candidatus Methylomirabilales bacterium]